MELEKLPPLLGPSLCLSALSPGPWITEPVHILWRKVGWQAGKSSRMFPEVEKRLSCLAEVGARLDLVWSELGGPQGLGHPA